MSLQFQQFQGNGAQSRFLPKRMGKSSGCKEKMLEFGLVDEIIVPSCIIGHRTIGLQSEAHSQIQNIADVEGKFNMKQRCNMLLSTITIDFWDFQDNIRVLRKIPTQILAAVAEKVMIQSGFQPCSPMNHQACWQPWHSFWSSGAFFSTWLYGWLYLTVPGFSLIRGEKHGATQALNSGCWHLPPIWKKILLAHGLAGKSLWTQRSRLFWGGSGKEQISWQKSCKKCCGV